MSDTLDRENKTSCCSTIEECHSEKCVKPVVKQPLAFVVKSSALPVENHEEEQACKDSCCSSGSVSTGNMTASSAFSSGVFYTIEGMDCGACAVTLEKHMKRLTAVQEVSVNFSAGKMQIVHDLTERELLSEVSKAGFKALLPINSESIDSRAGVPARLKSSRRFLSAVLMSGIFLAFGFGASYTAMPEWVTSVLYALAILIGGRKPARSAFYAIRSRSLDMNVLMTAAALGAAAIGEWLEGATVVFLFALGGELQSGAIERTRRSIRGLMELAPAEAWIRESGELLRVSVNSIRPGDVFVVKPGEKIPLDGEVIAGISAVDQAPITGESIPVHKEVGSPIYAGTINTTGGLQVKTTKIVGDTTLARIIHRVEEAQSQKAPAQAFVDRFARFYTPIVFAVAFLFMIVPPLAGWGSFGEWFYRGLEMLVVACPCALVISTPVAIVSAIGSAARKGVLIKGGAVLEAAGAIETIAFDKTGTLTTGEPVVKEVHSAEGIDEERLLRIARTIEESSEHPVALAVNAYAQDAGFASYAAEKFESIPGKGAKAWIDGVVYLAGSPNWLRESGISLDRFEKEIGRMRDEGYTLVAVGNASGLLGIIAAADSVREESKQTLNDLRKAGIRQTIMLTGDHAGTARRVASESGVDDYKADLLPEDKVAVIHRLQREGAKVAMIGDGINDAPALATADLGIAMGGAGTDTAMETAGIVLMADNLGRLPYTFALSRRTLRIIKQNIVFSIAIKAVALLLIVPGFLTLWIAVLSDTGAALLVVLNSMRLLKRSRENL